MVFTYTYSLTTNKELPRSPLTHFFDFFYELLQFWILDFRFWITPFPPEDYLLKNRQDAKDAKKKKEQER